MAHEGLVCAFVMAREGLVCAFVMAHEGQDVHL